jgi:hypothetical protein
MFNISPGGIILPFFFARLLLFAKFKFLLTPFLLNVKLKDQLLFLNNNGMYLVQFSNSLMI